MKYIIAIMAALLMASPVWAGETLSAFTEQKNVQIGIDKDGVPIMETQTKEKYAVPAGNIINVGTDAVSKKKIYKVLVSKKQGAELKKLTTYRGNSELDLAMNMQELAKDIVKVSFLDKGLDEFGKEIQIVKRVTYREWELLLKPERIGTYAPVVWAGVSDEDNVILFFIDEMKEVIE